MPEKISAEEYDKLDEQRQHQYRIYTVEDEDIEQGHPYPGHETWNDQ